MLSTEVILGPAWDGFGQRGGEMSCVGCGRPVDQYGFDEGQDDAMTTIVEASFAGIDFMCLECAAEAGFENPVALQRHTLRLTP